MFNVNVLGVTFATQEAVKAFGDGGGSIVNIGSAVTRMPYPGFSIYSATKAALESLTKVWAHELGKKNIRINAILPGMVDTEGTRALGRPGSEAEQIGIARTHLVARDILKTSRLLRCSWRPTRRHGLRAR